MKKPFWMVAWLLAIELVLVLVLIPGDWTLRAINKEADYVEKSLGIQSRTWIHDKASTWYRSSVIDSGAYEKVHRAFIPTEAEKLASRGMERSWDFWFNWIEGRLDAVLKVVYQFFSRLALAAIWAPYMLVLLLPAVFDGYMTWKIKRSNFDYSSPVVHRYSVRGVTAIVCGLFVAFFLPIAIDPIVIPIAMMGMCVLIGLSLGNLQKRI